MKLVFDHRLLRHINESAVKERGSASKAMLLAEKWLEKKIAAVPLSLFEHTLSFLLTLTSAWHMPRSMALFQREGWNVTPYPVDFRTSSYTSWSHYSIAEGALRWEMLLHEVVGLAVATHGFSR